MLSEDSPFYKGSKFLFSQCYFLFHYYSDFIYYPSYLTYSHDLNYHRPIENSQLYFSIAGLSTNLYIQSNILGYVLLIFT